jgi:hypothetical protein
MIQVAKQAPALSVAKLERKSCISVAIKCREITLIRYDTNEAGM